MNSDVSNSGVANSEVAARSGLYLDELYWKEFSQAFAFVGNSLLKPMNQTSDIGLEASFWRNFPDFEDDAVGAALSNLALWAESKEDASREDAIKAVSVEYTKLFVGPPRPVAPPWETMNLRDGVSVGFGEPTFEMQRLLADMGLKVSSDNNQYADHIGIEFLYASEVCKRIFDGGEGVDDGEGFANEESFAGEENSELNAQLKLQLKAQLELFIENHPLKWIDTLISKVDEENEGEYYSLLLRLGKALLGAALRAAVFDE